MKVREEELSVLVNSTCKGPEAETSMMALSVDHIVLPPALPGSQETSYNYAVEVLELR